VSKNRFCQNLGPFKLGQIASIIGTNIAHDQNDILIHNIKSLKDARNGDLTFLSNKKYVAELKVCQATVCLVPLNFELESKIIPILLRVPNPYYAYALLIYFILQQKS
jgi:UDP-3-O-[3-hydroxymyristoyl] glucosamine N-acyltransferase